MEYKAVIYGDKTMVIYMPEPITIKLPNEIDYKSFKIIKIIKRGNKKIIVAKLNVFELIALFDEYIQHLKI